MSGFSLSTLIGISVLCADLLLIDINQTIPLEWKLFATDENKVSNFTPDSLESKFLAETST